MTLIATYITREGLIHAADSNVTVEYLDRDPETMSGDKVFPVKHVNAGCCVTGSYRVGRHRFDHWVEDIIDRSAMEGDTTIAAFAERLRQRLQTEMTREQKYDEGTLVYVGGLVQTDAGSHPEIYAVRNMSLDETTGEYVNPGYIFECDEQFWERDYRKKNLEPLLASGGCTCYTNGFHPGRATHLALFSRFFQDVRLRHPTVRKPQTLADWTAVIDLQMSETLSLFKDFQPPYIGGPVQILSLGPVGGGPWLK